MSSSSSSLSPSKTWCRLPPHGERKKKSQAITRRRKSFGDNSSSSSSHSDDDSIDESHPSKRDLIWRNRRRSSLEKENKQQEAAAAEIRWGLSSSPPTKPKRPPSSSPRKQHHRTTTTTPKNNKSHGLSPSRFYHKKLDHTTTSTKTGSSPSKNLVVGVVVPEWKRTAEHSLLIQQHQQHTQQLEQRRKHFRSQTQLKLWPLQDMALEHVDYLLLKSNNSSTTSSSTQRTQFHGGDYLSAESSSSVSSVETKKKTTTTARRPAARLLVEQHTSTNHKEDVKTKESSSSPSSSTILQLLTSSVVEGNDDGASNTTTTANETNNNTRHPTSPLWSMEPRIFAIEKTQGKRKYLVGHFGRIADWYWRKAVPTSRHLYEVIREGTPCRLYFDLEFSTVHNPELMMMTAAASVVVDEKDGSSSILPRQQQQQQQQLLLLQEFQEELAADLKTYYNLPLQSSQIIHLDSSSDTKFSRHWIIHLTESKGATTETNDKEEEKTANGKVAASTAVVEQEVLFRDAPTVGRFVKRLVSRLAEERAVDGGGDFAKRRPMLAKYLFVNTKDDNKPTCFVDLGVYTRNRLFRCLGSSKFGKPATLQVILNDRDEEGGQQYFPLQLPGAKELDVSQSSQPLSMDDFVTANDWEPHAKALAESLVVPLRNWPAGDEDTHNNAESQRFSSRLLEVTDESYGVITPGTLLGTTKRSSDNSATRKSYRTAPTIPMARQGTRLPTLDKFIDEVLANRGGSHGVIRAWSVEYGHRDTPVSITYQMQRNRFCELIGRSHKSNNIFWTVDLTSWTCIQGCHDPDCHGRGSPVPIPNDNGRLDDITREFQTWQEEEFEKALSSLNIDDIVAQVTEKRIADANNATSGNDDNLSDDALLEAISNHPELFP